MSHTLNLHSILPASRANGPGLRMVIWFQGCTLGCPGCFNPETHTHEDRQRMRAADVMAAIQQNPNPIDGISISGGEPFQQAEGLAELVRTIRAESGLSILVFSGYTLTEIERMPDGKAVLACIDVLIAGRYVAAKHVGNQLLGSANQLVHFLTNRYTPDDLVETPPTEIVIDAEGNLIQTGLHI